MTSNTKYSRLLVGVDGSAASLHALREAFKISTSWVTVVAVTPFYEGDLRLLGVPKSDRIIQEPCDTALALAQEMADEVGAVIQPRCERGEPHERLVELAAAGSRDLIVLGSSGHNILENLLVGSVTRRVIGFTSKDILVVPPKATVGWEKILMATDGSAHSRQAADRALELARLYGSELLVVSVLDFPAGIRGVAPVARLELLKICENQVAEVVTRAEALKLQVEGFIMEGVAYTAIAELAQEQQANLIVMGSHGQTGLLRLLMGRVTERVIGHAPCPVLVVKGKE
ncbi:MAG: universal stress protein [Deltaproteobacteria bacterium]|nr:universal stress protein [Deltaproteobacteria bacterium]